MLSEFIKNKAIMLANRQGPKWNPEEKIWVVPNRLIQGTEFEARIPDEYLNGSKKL
jgi:hypothetical protein